MASILIRFWLKRFALVFVLACLGLGLVEFVQHGTGRFSVGSVVGWSAGAALLASSLSTYWAYRVQCRVVFKQPSE
ncbi:MAG: hypothetical protein HOQ10_06060 [Frateuria sp.]|uniref:hypothetical protein n=1 Tax=Frateuria sp. TaxID=2211372 RepID=UPI0017AE74EA|nr:hypothetical protein [Frateuria sp.]NUO72263.1 hypothetical protein [Frateuria sp.]NUR22706.1 hypothetical protein [Frateuria sp.]